MPMWFYSDSANPVTGAYADSQSSTNTWNWTAIGFGTAAANRYVVAIFGVASANNVTTMTIGGVSATLVLTATNSTEKIYVFIAAVPTGTSGNIATDGGGTGTMAISTYAIYGTSHPTTPTTFTGTSSISQTPVVAAGSFVIAAGLSISSTTSFTNITSDHTQTQGILALTVGSVAYVAGTTIGVTVGGSTPVCEICIWSP